MAVVLSREKHHIDKELDLHIRTVGESVVWFEFLSLISGESTYDAVYDESPIGSGGKKYGLGISLPTIYVEEVEDTNRAIAEGRQPVQKVNIVTSIRRASLAGMFQPWEYQQHLNDMFMYDGRFYVVTEYRARGRLRDEVLLVVVGQETYIDQEHVNDEIGTLTPFKQDYPWPSGFPSS